MILPISMMRLAGKPLISANIWVQYAVFVIGDYRRHGCRTPPATQGPNEGKKLYTVPR